MKALPDTDERIDLGESTQVSGRKRRKRPRLRLRDRFVFTDNRHPSTGILSALLGLLSIGGIITAIARTFLSGGTVYGNITLGGVICAIYAVAGLILAIHARFERNVFMFFPKLGTVLNICAILAIAGLYYLGW